MIFVSLLEPKAGTMAERVGKRMEWQYPEGARVIGEYWLYTNDPRVILICEADSIEPIAAMFAAWEDLFNINIYPAVTAEQGMESAKKMMQG